MRKLPSKVLVLTAMTANFLTATAAAAEIRSTARGSRQLFFTSSPELP